MEWGVLLALQHRYKFWPFVVSVFGELETQALQFCDLLLREVERSNAHNLAFDPPRYQVALWRDLSARLQLATTSQIDAHCAHLVAAQPNPPPTYTRHLLPNPAMIGADWTVTGL